MGSEPTSAANCPYCGDPKDRHEYASRTTCIIGSPKAAAAKPFHTGSMPPRSPHWPKVEDESAASDHSLAAMTEAEFWPLIEQAKERVLTNDLDALELLIVDGLPPKEMQAAAWALVQRVRGLHADLARLEQARAAWAKEARSNG